MKVCQVPLGRRELAREGSALRARRGVPLLFETGQNGTDRADRGMLKGGGTPPPPPIP